MLKKIAVVFAAVLLSGCAQFAAMTPQQKKVTAASIAGAVVLGYLVNDDDDTFVTNVTEIHEGNTVIVDRCHPRPKC